MAARFKRDTRQTRPVGRHADWQHSVFAIAAHGTNVYVGGCFPNAGAVGALNVARWDGARWSALGSGVNNTVYALALSGDELFVGGFLSRAGGQPSLQMGLWHLPVWRGPEITTLQFSGPDCRIGFTSRAGSIYQAERRNTLGAGEWTPFAPGLPGTGDLITVTDTNGAGLPLRFYRLTEQ